VGAENLGGYAKQVGAQPQVSSSFEQITSPAETNLGDLVSWAQTGLVDREFVRAEAERKKAEIDRALEHTLNELDLQWQHQRAALQQQADMARKHAEQQVREAEKAQLDVLHANAEASERGVAERVAREKGRLGEEAYAAIVRLTEKEKKRISETAAYSAEEAFRKTQLYLRDQVFASNQQIHSEATSKIQSLEKEARSALSLVYLPPNVQMPAEGIDGTPAKAAVDRAFQRGPLASFAPGAAVPLANPGEKPAVLPFAPLGEGVPPGLSETIAQAMVAGATRPGPGPNVGHGAPGPTGYNFSPPSAGDTASYPYPPAATSGSYAAAPGTSQPGSYPQPAAQHTPQAGANPPAPGSSGQRSGRSSRAH